MPCRLRREEIVTIEVLDSKQVAARAIARQLGVCEGTVRYHLKRKGAADGRCAKPFAAQEFAPVIEAWFSTPSDRPVNVRALYDSLVADHGYRDSYKSVLRYVRHRFGAPPIRTYRRVETPPGAQAQSDWGIFPRVDLGAGPERLSAFVMTLSYSRMPAIVWSTREDQLSWLECHNRAFERLGGVPAVNRIDNPKTAMSAGAGAWGTIHPVYAAYARSMGFHVDACAPRSPEAKGKVESKVRLSRRLVDVARERFEGIEGLQARSDESVRKWSERAVCPATGESVAATWEKERELLRPLPVVLPQPFDLSVLRVVGRDALVSFESHQYSVPFEFSGLTVEVRGCAGKVQILSAEGRLLREYPRGTAKRLWIDPSCYEGQSTDRVLAPPPLGVMGSRLAEIIAMPVEQRPLDLYAALAEVAR